MAATLFLLSQYENAIGREVLVKRAVWPTEPVDDEAVRGWRAVIVRVKKGGSRKTPVEQVQYSLQYSLVCPTPPTPLLPTQMIAKCNGHDYTFNFNDINISPIT